MKQSTLMRSIVSMVALVTSAAGAAEPVPVSPGAPDRFTGVASPCPTFTWSAVDAARDYELVVYRVPEIPERVDVAGLRHSEPALRAVVPAGALAWTPAAEECLDLDQTYAWTIRALGANGESWSASRLFEIDPGAVLIGVADALERALGRYLDQRGIRFEPDGGLAELLVDELAARPAAGTSEPVTERVRYIGGKRLLPGERIPDGVFNEDVELTLVESGSGASDYVQLALDTPTATGSSAWALVVAGDDGTLFLSGPTFFDAFQADPTDSTLLVPRLELPQIVRLSPLTSGSRPACSAAAEEGRLYYDSTDGLCYCDGTGWKQVDGNAAC